MSLTTFPSLELSKEEFSQPCVFAPNLKFGQTQIRTQKRRHKFFLHDKLLVMRSIRQYSCKRTDYANEIILISLHPLWNKLSMVLFTKLQSHGLEVTTRWRNRARIVRRDDQRWRSKRCYSRAVKSGKINCSPEFRWLIPAVKYSRAWWTMRDTLERGWTKQKNGREREERKKQARAGFQRGVAWFFRDFGKLNAKRKGFRWIFDASRVGKPCAPETRGNRKMSGRLAENFENYSAMLHNSISHLLPGSHVFRRF